MLVGVLSDNLCNLEVRKCEIFKIAAIGVSREVSNIANTNVYFQFLNICMLNF